jgi:hypothetical protein
LDSAATAKTGAPSESPTEKVEQRAISW